MSDRQRRLAESTKKNKTTSPGHLYAHRTASRFLSACRGEKVDRTPIWLMRQAGRFIPEFREIRSRVSFLDSCKDPELACKITLMPVDMFHVDAAIIFADILLPLEPLGVGLEYVKGEGPLIANPVRTNADVDGLRPCHAEEHLGYVLKAIELTRRALPDDVPLIGFAGAPFTLASYMIEGGSSRHFEATKQFMHCQSAAWAKLMQKLVALTAEYLNAQVEAGADAVQLFDSWVGCLSPSDYQQYVLPHVTKLIETVVDTVPFIHFGTGTAGLLCQMRQAGGDVIGVDWRISLDEAWRTIGFDTGIQGNLDPMVLLSDKETIARQASRVLSEAQGRKGHIFNLGHGVLPPTNPDHVKFLVDLVHNHQLEGLGKTAND